MKKLKFLIIPLLIATLLIFGMNSFASLHSKWSAGDLIFYDGATNIWTIRDGTDGVKIYDDLNLTFGTDNDATIVYDELTSDKLKITCANGITLSGAMSFVSGLSSSGQTLTPDATRTYIAYQIGNRVTEKDITMAGATDQNLDPMQFNLNIIGTAPTGSSTLNLSYAQITHDTVSMPNLRIKVTDWTVDIGEAVQDAYVLQTELIVGGTKTSSGELIAVSALTTLGTGARTADRVCALQAMITGSGTAGTVVGDAIVAYFVNAGTVVTTDDIVKVYNQSAATVIDGIEIENDGTITNAIKINNDGTCAVGVLFEGAFTTAAISMDGATFAALSNEIEMRNNVAGDKTIIASGTAIDDAGIVAAVGADADIADGSLYMSCTDGAGVLFIKKNDVWTAFTNP